MEKNLPEEQLREELNQETGKLEWKELAPHFARGVVISVDARLDLVDVAVSMIKDDSEKVHGWIEDKMVKRADDDDAKRWTERHCIFWAVVAAPWVIVQEVVEN